MYEIVLWSESAAPTRFRGRSVVPEGSRNTDLGHKPYNNSGNSSYEIVLGT
jgi:hypothetical protein